MYYMRGERNLGSVEELLKECGRLHGHICPGQLLGVRLTLLGCRLVEISDPRGADRKKLIVWVEIDRCMAEAVRVVALDSSRELADTLYPEIESKKERQMRAYRELPDSALFKVEAVSIE